MEPRRQARSYLLGLLADVETRSCWQLAEHAGEPSPHRMQRLLSEAVWDADAVRDDVRGYVANELGDPQAVLIIDDTGDLKKGVHSVGVQRHYTGTAGRIENAPVTLQEDELEDYGLFHPEQAARRVAPHVARRIPAAVHAATTGTMTYLPLVGGHP